MTHYTYTVDGQEIDLAPSKVVHFRFGMDPENERKGRSPLAAALREIFTDDEAANYTASLLRNMGVPGIIVSPDVNGDQINEAEAEETKGLSQDGVQRRPARQAVRLNNPNARVSVRVFA